MITNLILAVLLALPGSFGGAAWDKPPEKWNLADVYRILQDSPWCPAELKLEAKGASREEDPQTGMVADSPINSNEANPVPGMQISRSKPQAAIPVYWWSSRTVRLAEQRLLQLRNPTLVAQPLKGEDLPDYVLVIEGSEPLRILSDAKDDLHDTVFLELPDGGTLDFESVRFADRTEQAEPRVEFHFPRLVDGQPTLNPDAERVIFHCKASAKIPRPFQQNSLAPRAEFKPKTMRVRGVPDL